jgi:hypothetical protein
VAAAFEVAGLEAVGEAAGTGRGVGVALLVATGDATCGADGESVGSGAVRAAPGLLDPPQAAVSSSASRGGAHGDERICAGCRSDPVPDRGRWS